MPSIVMREINATFGAGTIIDGRRKLPSQPCSISSGPPGPRATRPIQLRPPCDNIPPGLRLPALGLEPGRFQIAYGASPPRRTDRRYRDACLSALEHPR